MRRRTTAASRTWWRNVENIDVSPAVYKTCPQQRNASYTALAMSESVSSTPRNRDIHFKAQKAILHNPAGTCASIPPRPPGLPRPCPWRRRGHPPPHARGRRRCKARTSRRKRIQHPLIAQACTKRPTRNTTTARMCIQCNTEALHALPGPPRAAARRAALRRSLAPPRRRPPPTRPPRRKELHNGRKTHSTPFCM